TPYSGAGWNGDRRCSTWPGSSESATARITGSGSSPRASSSRTSRSVTTPGSKSSLTPATSHSARAPTVTEVSSAGTPRIGPQSIGVRHHQLVALARLDQPLGAELLEGAGHRLAGGAQLSGEFILGTVERE